jgi:hypothetical protein
MAQSGHALLHCICPLMTQSGHYLTRHPLPLLPICYAWLASSLGLRAGWSHAPARFHQGYCWLGRRLAPFGARAASRASSTHRHALSFLASRPIAGLAVAAEHPNNNSDKSGNEKQKKYRLPIVVSFKSSLFSSTFYTSIAEWRNQPPTRPVWREDA